MSDSEKEDDGMVDVKEQGKDLEGQLSKLKDQLASIQAELKTTQHEKSQLELKYKESVEAQDELRKENERLSVELQKFTSTAAERVNAEIQTDEVWLGTETDYSTGYHSEYYQSWSQHAASSSYGEYTENTAETKKVGDLGEDGMPVWDTTQDNTEEQAAGGSSIAEGLKAAATEALQETGVVYDEASGMYYDPASGYYVNPDRSLYYEPHSGTYYVYDHEKQEYKFHSQVDVNQYHNQGNQDANDAETKPNMKVEVAREKRRQRKQKVQRFVAHISDRKERRRVGKRLSKRLKREEKLEALRGRNDKAANKKRRQLLRQTQSRGKSKRKNRRDSDEEEKMTDKKPAKRKPASTKESTANGDNINCDKPKSKSTHRKDVKLKTKKKQTKKKQESSVDMFAEDNDGNNKAANKEEAQQDGRTSPHGEEKTEKLEDESSMDESEEESEVEEGQLSSEEESMEVEEENGRDEEKENEENLQSEHEEESVPVHYAPCIRAMVIQSDSLDEASLFIITCMGGTMGRDPTLKHVISIPDVNISKAHTEVAYREDLKKYIIKDLASQNGTFLNNHRLSEPKVMSEAYPLSHRDVLTLGGTTLMLHIHPGTETCDECEPGQARAVFEAMQEKDKSEVSIMTKAEKEQLRRQQLKMIKKKFGLENMSYVENKDALNNPSYQDKAEERRQTKGSDNPYQPDDAPASVDRPITETNKGHQLLAKMGWKEGQGLGRDEQGRAEPVQASIRSVHGAGLGADDGAVSLDNIQMTAAAARRAKTRGRFQQLKKGNKPNVSQPARGDEIKTAGPVAPPTWVKGDVLEPS